MAINEPLADVVTDAIDRYQKGTEPALMVGDIIDTLRQIADKLDAVLYDQQRRQPN